MVEEGEVPYSSPHAAKLEDDNEVEDEAGPAKAFQEVQEVLQKVQQFNTFARYLPMTA